MRFTRNGDLIRVVHVTGPTHNLLGLQLATEPLIREIEELDVPGARQLEAADVEREVCAGVEDANAALGTRFAVGRIQFVPSDSGPASFYRELARAVVQHVAEETGTKHPFQRAG